MPPKSRYSRNDIIQGALRFIQQEGLENLTARSLAASLGVSTKPLFDAFENMEEIISECRSAVIDFYNDFNPEIEDKQFYIAKKYVAFAIQEPELFKFRYHNKAEKPGTLKDVLKSYDPDYEETVRSIKESAPLISFEMAEKLYEDVWLYIHGIAELIISGQCNIQLKDVSSRINDISIGMCTYYLSKK